MIDNVCSITYIPRFFLSRGLYLKNKKKASSVNYLPFFTIN
jgi:hypothetical protein